jgi:hypothetical protein
VSDESPAQQNGRPVLKRRKPKPQAPGWRLPKMVQHPETGEWVRPAGPPQFWYSSPTKSKRGRPPTPSNTIIHRIIQGVLAKMRTGDTTSQTAIVVDLVLKYFPNQRTSENVDRVSRWLRDPSRGVPPWEKTF